MERLNPTEQLINRVIACSLKVGDEVICISNKRYPDQFGNIKEENQPLTVGKKYKIVEIDINEKDSHMIRVIGDDGTKFGYFALRFKKEKS